MSDEWSLGDVCERVGVPRTTLLGWLDSGILGCSRLDDGRRVFSQAQLRWAEAVSELSRRGVSVEHMKAAVAQRGTALGFLYELTAACQVACSLLEQSMSVPQDRLRA